MTSTLLRTLISYFSSRAFRDAWVELLDLGIDMFWGQSAQFGHASGGFGVKTFCHGKPQ